MTDHDKQFIPEQIDEQIDQYAQDIQHPMHSFIQDMRVVLQDDNDTFDRVEDKLLDYIRQARKPIPIASHQTSERTHFMTQTSGLQRSKRRSRFIIPITLVAALVLAVLVTGSAFAIFQFAHSQQAHNNNTTPASTNKPLATPTATPTPDVPALPSDLCPTDSTDSWYAICTSRQYTMINQTQTVNTPVTLDQTQTTAKQAVTIYAGYADSNNVIIAYGSKITDKTTAVVPPNLSLSAQNGIILGGGSGGGNASADMNYMVQFFTVSKVPAGTTALDLTVDNGLFHFSLPLHQGHITTINQTQVSNGQAVTLEYVSVSPTMTRIFLKGPSFITGMAPAPNADPSIPPYVLTIGNDWSNEDHQRGFNTNAIHENSDPLLPATGLELDFSSPLMNQKGEWTLILRNDIVSGATNDIVFHFIA